MIDADIGNDKFSLSLKRYIFLKSNLNQMKKLFQSNEDKILKKNFFLKTI